MARGVRSTRTTKLEVFLYLEGVQHEAEEVARAYQGL
jgi:hypothetical protein